MFDHVTLRASDRDASERFSDTVLATGSFSLVPGDTPTGHLHRAFAGADNASVDAFHAAATGAGHRDNGAPGERPVYHDGHYAAFVLDRDGHNAEVVNHNR